MMPDHAARPGSYAAHLSELASAMTEEAHLIGELRETLRRQRAGVAESDIDAIEDSLQALGRTLFTLDEARRRRAAITATLTGHDSMSHEGLESLLGRPLPEPVASASLAMQRAALQASEDVAVNQQILKRALEVGESFLQQLFATASDPLPGYQAGERRLDQPAPTGFLINRTA
jgi:hypothetical protein